MATLKLVLLIVYQISVLKNVNQEFLLEMLVRGTKYEVARAGHVH